MKVKQFLKHFWQKCSDIREVRIKTDLTAGPGSLIEPCEYDGTGPCWHEDLLELKVNLFQIQNGVLTIHAR